MPRTRPPYPEELRNRIVELARNGRPPRELAEEFEPTEQTIRNWLKQAERDDGYRSDEPTTEEKEEIRELRKKLRDDGVLRLSNGRGNDPALIDWPSDRKPKRVEIG